MSAIRGAGFALGAAWNFSWSFGVTFGVLSTIGQSIAYRFGIRPSAEYRPDTRPRISRFLMLAALNRTAGYAVTGYVASLVAQQRDHAIAVGLTTGVAIGVVTATAGIFTPFIEWTADHMPARRMGVLGVGMILVGFGLQSVQYWIALLQ